MEVDTLILRHRQRLLEHRRFLAEGSAGVSAGGEGDAPDSSLAHRAASNSSNANITSQSSLRGQQQTREAHIVSSLSQAMDVSQRAASSTTRPHRGDSRGRLDAGESQTATVSSPAVHDMGGDADEGAASFFGFAGAQEQAVVEDRLLQQHLNQAGRYYVDGPADALYQRGVWWLSNREKHRKTQEEQRAAMELRECTFKPNRSSSNQADGQQGTTNKTPNKYLSPAGTSSGGAARSVSPADLAAMSRHLLRQQQARNLRDEAKRRLEGPDIANWTPRQTKPKGPELGKRNVAVASLRQPVWGRAGDEPYGSDGEYSPQRRPQTTRVPLSDDEDLSSAARQPPQHVDAAREATTEEDEPSRSRSRKGKPGFDRSNNNNKSTELQMLLHRKEEENTALQQKLAEQQATIQSLKRELEVAKGMVRKMTLESAAAGV